MEKVAKSLNDYLKEVFDLESDRASFPEIILSISKNVEFKGTNLWILIFAIIIASVGLNMNSTAVIIGAMLISPLMGPIIGIGLGIGIYDFNLIKKAARNLLIAVFISVVTSALYFWISPLKDAQSELLGRTLPTIWDVVIAFFGGLAGIVASTRQEKSNVIPGVAIATALMPPLCTAGYGIATGNLYYFLGAFYLFFINSVFITIATLLIVRYMRVPYKEWVNPEQQRKMRYSVIIVTVLTMIPSIFLAYDIVRRSLFTKNADEFVDREFNDPSTVVLKKNLDPANRKIQLYIFGDKLDSTQISNLQNKLLSYNLSNTQLVIRQEGYSPDPSSIEMMKSGIIEDMYIKNEAIMHLKDSTIQSLQSELSNFREVLEMSDEVSKEVAIQYPEIKDFSLSKTIIYHKNNQADTTVMAAIRSSKRLSNTSKNRLAEWLKERLDEKNVEIISY